MLQHSPLHEKKISISGKQIYSLNQGLFLTELKSTSLKILILVLHLLHGMGHLICRCHCCLFIFMGYVIFISILSNDMFQRP